MTVAARPPPDRYDPWRDLAVHWPDVEVRIEPMTGSLLGVLRYPVIVLRAGTSAAQRRCTLTHEIVHLSAASTIAARGPPARNCMSTARWRAGSSRSARWPRRCVISAARSNSANSRWRSTSTRKRRACGWTC